MTHNNIVVVVMQLKIEIIGEKNSKAIHQRRYKHTATFLHSPYLPG